MKSLIKKTARNAVFSINKASQGWFEIYCSLYARNLGRDQRNKYLGILDNCFHLLADEPGLGVACDEIRKNYRKFCIERHIIFYRKVADDIDVVRILHCRMDVEKQLFD